MGKKIGAFCFGMVLLLVTPTLFGQSGPAGVGSAANNPFWIKADAGTSTTVNGAQVSFWNDQSGNLNNATQGTSALQPKYVASLINGMPAIQFDNASGATNADELVVPDNDNLDNTPGLTIFTVSQPNSLDNAAARAIISKRELQDINESYMLFYFTNNKFYTDVQGNGNRFPTAFTFANSTNYIASLVFDGTLPAATRAQIYVNDALETLPAHSESSTAILNNASTLTIGTLNTGDGRPFGGHIAEVIIYTKALNPAERIIVSNYLSAKYNISLSANDLYQGDNSSSGNFDFEVGGVGTESAGSNASVASAVTGGFAMTQSSGFQNGDYVIYGHQAGANTSSTDVAGMTGASNSRWSRMWYVDVTNSGPNEVADIVFDLSDGGSFVTPANAVNYVLLFRAGISGAWTEVATASSITGDRISFPTFPLSTDGYYTIGTRDVSASPLPIKLLDFKGTLTEKGVELEWTTASETNNETFTIERSENGKDFDRLTEVAGAGNSLTEQTYYVTDPYAFVGKIYYRLKQTDVDKAFTYSGVISISAGKMLADYILFPNPAKDVLNIQLTGEWINPQVKLFDVSSNPVYFADFEKPSLRIDTRNFPRGFYIIYLSNGAKIWKEKIVLE